MRGATPLLPPYAFTVWRGRLRLFFYQLLLNFTVAQTTQRRMIRWMVNNQLQGLGKVDALIKTTIPKTACRDYGQLQHIKHNTLSYSRLQYTMNHSGVGLGGVKLY